MHTRAEVLHLPLMQRCATPRVQRSRQGFITFARRLRIEGTPFPTFTAPAFSHAEKDPVYNALSIGSQHTIVIVEGLYSCLDVAPWADAAMCWDKAWFLDVPRETARARVAQRHVEAGLSTDITEALRRSATIAFSECLLAADANDQPNGDWILAHTPDAIERLSVPLV